MTLSTPAGRTVQLSVDSLDAMPQVSVSGCYIVSTGHGASGPFTFGGVRLLDVVERFVPDRWTQVEVISADGFGNRVYRPELEGPSPEGTIILAIRIDGARLTREQGLVRLVVPSEREDALRQVKWVSEIRVLDALGDSTQR
jgi:DMSO/TMAO reductase YedYZ molybdopterin-dependent catalytic subunit